jgi:hypothetical protein
MNSRRCSGSPFEPTHAWQELSSNPSILGGTAATETVVTSCANKNTMNRLGHIDLVVLG